MAPIQYLIVPNGCSTVDSVIVFQNNTPPALVIQSALEELDCNNPTVSLIAESPTSNISYEWFDDQNNSIGNTPVVDDISQVGVYTVIITDINNGCTSSDFIEVIDNTDYPLAEAGNPTLINCFDPEITLDGSASQSGTDINYLWFNLGYTSQNFISGLPTSIRIIVLPASLHETVLQELHVGHLEMSETKSVD